MNVGDSIAGVAIERTEGGEPLVDGGVAEVGLVHLVDPDAHVRGVGLPEMFGAVMVCNVAQEEVDVAPIDSARLDAATVATVEPMFDALVPCLLPLGAGLVSICMGVKLCEG